MSARLLAFDVETTGKNPEFDEIIELSVCFPGQSVSDAWIRRLKPTVSITPGAFRVHGISTEMLEDAPSFGDIADELRGLFEQADVVVGYNVRFDIRFVDAAFERLGQPSPLQGKQVVDPLRLWHAMEPRRLENAVERFVGGTIENAHNAAEDAVATLQVLDGVRREFGLEEMSWTDLSELTDPDRLAWIGPTNHFRWEGDAVVFGFGKHDGRSIFQVDPSYLRWVQKTKFPAHVHNLCKGALSGISPEAFLARVRDHFGGPPSETDQAANLDPAVDAGTDVEASLSA